VKIIQPSKKEQFWRFFNRLLKNKNSVVSLLQEAKKLIVSSESVAKKLAEPKKSAEHKREKPTITDKNE
jgi:N-glycosylase/DNA lyase